MYPLEWIERLKLGKSPPGARNPVTISPVVLSLGLTSLLTDVSSEMVNSLLPAYVVLHLHLSPLQFGVIDGLYNGFAIALVSIVAGFMADRRSRQKGVALAGYGLSGVCKLLLLAVGTTYAWILFIVGIDRLGKGIRAAPRDALISLNTPSGSLASAFAVHRAMDACGSLLGPVVAFLLLAALPGEFDAVWVTSFAFSVLGFAALWLLVPGAVPAAAAPAVAATSLW
jgi:MFS family permease